MAQFTQPFLSPTTKCASFALQSRIQLKSCQLSSEQTTVNMRCPLYDLPPTMSQTVPKALLITTYTSMSPISGGGKQHVSILAQSPFGSVSTLIAVAPISLEPHLHLCYSAKPTNCCTLSPSSCSLFSPLTATV